MIKHKITIFFLLLLLFIPNVYAEEIEECTMSKEYQEWLDSDDKESLVEPNYCDIDSTINNFWKDLTVKELFTTLVSAFESRYSAYDEGYVTSSKNQHENNACWAFTATSLLETQSIYNNLLTKEQANFSEAHVFYNTARNGFENVTLNTYNRTLTTGGNSIVAAAYYFNGKGPVSESSFPYSDDVVYQQKSYMDNSFDKPVVSVDEFFYETHYDEAVSCTDFVLSLKTRIKTYKSVGTNIYYDDSFMNVVGGNYYYKYNGDSNVGNHAVVLVGWDDTIPASYFKNATSNGGWIAKNSWGSSWANNGFFYISYEDFIICKDSYNFVANKNYSFDNSYNSSDVFGNLVFSISSPVYITAKFQNTGNEILDKISFSVVENTNYTAYLSLNNNINDSSDWIELGSGTSNTNGVKSLYFDGKYISNPFSIIIRYQAISSDSTKFYAMCSSNNEQALVSNMNISKGSNYYFTSISGVKYDMGDITQTIQNETYNGCESVIYAYTKNNNANNITSNNGSFVVENNTVSINLSDKKELTKDFLVGNLSINGSYLILDINNSDVTSSAVYIGTGYKIQVNGAIYNIIVKGDVSGDGKIKSNDALLISRHLVNLASLDQIKLSAADVSGDSKIKSNDALLISRFLIGLKNSL